MPSGLMRKLNAMRTPAPAPARKPPELVCRVATYPADARLFALSPTALRRIGFTGNRFDIRRALFLDTETTGLSGGAGTVAFLVGIGFVEGRYFTVEQYLMPDYSAEGMLLSRLAEKFPNYDTVVHFNGKTFDMPLLESRFVLRRMANEWRSFEQLDLLPPSRRLWKLRVGSCRLSHLEEAILHLPRENDIPGAEIPQRYFDAVKTGDLSGLEDVITHNRQDIVTLTTLLCELCDRYGNPEDTSEQLDLFSLGKALERQGEIAPARRLYHLAAVPRTRTTLKDLIGEKYAGEANLRLYHIYRRAGDYAQAEAVLQNMLKRGQMGTVPKQELAKLYEHRFKNYREALNITRELLKTSAPEGRASLEKRALRLEQKIHKQSGG